MSLKFLALGLILVIFCAICFGDYPEAQVTDQVKKYFTNKPDMQSSPFMRPLNTPPVSIYLVYMFSINQSGPEKSVRQIKISYTNDNDLYRNHPICVYKYALSTNTSDG